MTRDIGFLTLVSFSIALASDPNLIDTHAPSDPALIDLDALTLASDPALIDTHAPSATYTHTHTRTQTNPPVLARRLPGPLDDSCRCNGHQWDGHGASCTTASSDKLWCYVNTGYCVDKKNGWGRCMGIQGDTRRCKNSGDCKNCEDAQDSKHDDYQTNFDGKKIGERQSEPSCGWDECPWVKLKFSHIACEATYLQRFHLQTGESDMCRTKDVNSVRDAADCASQCYRKRNWGCKGFGLSGLKCHFIRSGSTKNGIYKDDPKCGHNPELVWYTKKAQICAASEHMMCECTGHVFFGNKYATGQQGDSNDITSFEQMKEKDFKQKVVRGQVKCSSADMGGDPLQGHAKHCYCIKQDASLGPSGQGSGSDYYAGVVLEDDKGCPAPLVGSRGPCETCFHSSHCENEPVYSCDPFIKKCVEAILISNGTDPYTRSKCLYPMATLGNVPFTKMPGTMPYNAEGQCAHPQMSCYPCDDIHCDKYKGCDDCSDDWEVAYQATNNEDRPIQYMNWITWANLQSSSTAEFGKRNCLMAKVNEAHGLLARIHFHIFGLLLAMFAQTLSF